jgi:hypothetical protein
MLLRDPQPYPEFKRKFNEFETELEHPAMPKESSWPDYSGISNPCPGWHAPLVEPKKPLDIEKLIGRAFIVAGFITMLFLGSIYIAKVIQFSMSVTIK